MSHCRRLTRIIIRTKRRWFWIRATKCPRSINLGWAKTRVRSVYVFARRRGRAHRPLDAALGWLRPCNVAPSFTPCHLLIYSLTPIVLMLKTSQTERKTNAPIQPAPPRHISSGQQARGVQLWVLSRVVPKRQFDLQHRRQRTAALGSYVRFRCLHFAGLLATSGRQRVGACVLEDHKRCVRERTSQHTSACTVCCYLTGRRSGRGIGARTKTFWWRSRRRTLGVSHSCRSAHVAEEQR